MRRATCLTLLLAATLGLAACSYTTGEGELSPPRNDSAPATRPSVKPQAPTAITFLTLPPVTTAPAATASESTAVSAPPSSLTRPAPTSVKPPTTTATGSTTTLPGKVGVQAGVFTTSSAAAKYVQQLTGLGFKGFTVLSSGNFRVVRLGIPSTDATQLVTQLRSAGVQAFVVR